MFDVIIIGAGPIGLCCAIEAKKKNLSYFDYNNSSECCLPCSSECKKVEEKINERELADLEKSEIHEILNLFITLTLILSTIAKEFIIFLRLILIFIKLYSYLF